MISASTLLLILGAVGCSALGYVLVPLAGVYIFGEQIRRVHGVGMVLIIIGVACLLYGD